MRQKLVSIYRAFKGDTAGNIAVLPLHGTIMAGKRGRQSINLENTEKMIARAFSMPSLKAVALTINSPGGSPVQSALIMQRIRDLADKRDVPVIAFTEDIAASGGYMIALAADEIIAHPASLIGSIGVIYSGFGFTTAMKKFGIERRLHTAGKKKSFMDPFLPEKKEDIARLKSLQKDLYDYFVDLVRTRRGKRLKGTNAKVFSGDIWTGEEAKKLGLIDGVVEMRSILKERFGDGVRILRVLPPKPPFASLFGMRPGKLETPKADLSLFSAEEILSAIEERMMWNRWGL